MIRSRIESNPRLLNLSRQTNPNPRGPEYVAEEVESNDPDSHSMSQIETNSMERLSRRQKYEKNQIAAKQMISIKRATSEISQNKVLEKRRMMFNVINMARNKGTVD